MKVKYDTLTLEKIKSWLCAYDERNLDYLEPYSDKDINSSDCYCDHCFSGRSILANELLLKIEGS